MIKTIICIFTARKNTNIKNLHALYLCNQIKWKYFETLKGKSASDQFF